MSGDTQQTRAPKIALGFAFGAVAGSFGWLFLSSDYLMRLAFFGFSVAAPTAVVVGGVGLARGKRGHERAIAAAAVVLGLLVIGYVIIAAVALARDDR